MDVSLRFYDRCWACLVKTGEHLLMEKQKVKKRETYSTKIGPLLKNVFVKQKEKIKTVTYDCVNSSDYEVGEIIAKKILDNKLI